jgi:hypothetical protein
MNNGSGKMNSKLIILTLVILLTFSAHSTQIPGAHAWGWATHRFVASEAIGLPDNFNKRAGSVDGGNS